MCPISLHSVSDGNRLGASGWCPNELQDINSDILVTRVVRQGEMSPYRLGGIMDTDVPEMVDEPVSDSETCLPYILDATSTAGDGINNIRAPA